MVRGDLRVDWFRFGLFVLIIVVRGWDYLIGLDLDFGVGYFFLNYKVYISGEVGWECWGIVFIIEGLGEGWVGSKVSVLGELILRVRV